MELIRGSLNLHTFMYSVVELKMDARKSAGKSCFSPECIVCIRVCTCSMCYLNPFIPVVVKYFGNTIPPKAYLKKKI